MGADTDPEPTVLGMQGLNPPLSEMKAVDVPAPGVPKPMSYAMMPPVSATHTILPPSTSNHFGATKPPAVIEALAELTLLTSPVPLSVVVETFACVTAAVNEVLVAEVTYKPRPFKNVDVPNPPRTTAEPVDNEFAPVNVATFDAIAYAVMGTSVEV